MTAFRQAAAGLLLTLGLTLAAPVPPPRWEGKIVYVKKQGLWLVDDPKAAKPKQVVQLTFINYRVLAEKNGWIKVRDKTAEGWLPKDELVPVEDAKAFFTKRIEANPRDVNAYMARASVQQMQKDFDGAIKDLSEAIRIRPNAAACWVNRGTLWRVKKDDEQAIKDFTEALRLDPKQVIALNERGNALARKRQYDAALADFNEAIRVSPTFPASYRNRGRTWVAKKEFDKALADFNEAIRLNPKDAACWNDRGLLRVQKKEHDKAIEDFTEAIRQNRQFKEAFNNRGLAWKNKKEHEKALRDFQEATALDAKYAAGLNNLAWLLATCPEAKLRDGKKAVDLARRACELTGWKNAHYLDSLAAAHAEAGQFDEAVKWQKKALEDKAYSDRYGKAGAERLRGYEEKKPYRQE
jgi:tetratricopeptide (TPR) repeat protein